MSETLGVLIDYGNSETRFYTIYEGHSWYKTLNNQYVKITEALPMEYCNKETNTFVVNGITYAQGQYVMRECSMQSIRPNAIQKKIEQAVTTYTTHLVLCCALRTVAQYKKCKVEDLDVNIRVGLLLPAAEHNKDSEAFKSAIMNVKRIEAKTPVAFVKDIDIEKVFIVPEGAAAYMNAIYDIDDNGKCVLRQENQQFITGDLLVLDIGAGTTDIVQMRDGDLILSSKDTLHKGGRTIESSCKGELEKKFEYKISDADMRHIFQDGTLIQGTATHDVTDILNSVKEKFSSVLFNYLVEYIERHEIEPRALKGLLVVGGGALETVRDGKVVSAKIADVLIKYIRGLTNTVALVDTSACDPRKMNIDGLKMYYIAQN